MISALPGSKARSSERAGASLIAIWNELPFTQPAPATGLVASRRRQTTKTFDMEPPNFRGADL